MILLVCGGRDFFDEYRLRNMLDRIHLEHGVTLLIHGAAPGADRMAGIWAKQRGVPVLAFPADWKRYKNAAGPIRNKQMLTEGKPERVLAFPGGSGTAHMVRLATEAGVPVMEG